MNSEELFQEWISQNRWIRWTNPDSVREAFIKFGDYIINIAEDQDIKTTPKQ